MKVYSDFAQEVSVNTHGQLLATRRRQNICSNCKFTDIVLYRFVARRNTVRPAKARNVVGDKNLPPSMMRYFTFEFSALSFNSLAASIPDLRYWGPFSQMRRWVFSEFSLLIVYTAVMTICVGIF